MKNIFLFLFILLAILGNTSELIAGEKLVASLNSDRYHVSSCKVAQKIPSNDKIEFKSPEEALGKNLNPCKKCYPPTSSNIRD